MSFKSFLRRINNRYVYVTIGFLIIILFVDQFNVFKQYRLGRTLNDQKRQIDYYEDEIAKSKELLEMLKTDSATMEKVAREEYMMKRDNEIIYLIYSPHNEADEQ